MGLMEEKIAEAIHEYAKEPKPVDLEFYARVADPVIASYEIRNYICALELNNWGRDKVPVTYDPLTGKIEMNHYRLEVENPEIEQFYPMFDEEEALAFYAAVITQRLLHSFEHVAQIQRREFAQDNFLETRLTRICGKGFVVRKKIELFDGIKCDYVLRSPLDIRGLEIKHKYYKFDPMERLAEIKSYETMVNIMEYLKDRYPNLYGYEETSYKESLLTAYRSSWQFGLCPTAVYLNGVGLSNDWDSFDFPDDYTEAIEKAYDEYSLEDRLRYGLPVHTNEYIDCYDELSESKKYKYKRQHP